MNKKYVKISKLKTVTKMSPKQIENYLGNDKRSHTPLNKFHLK